MTYHLEKSYLEMRMARSTFVRKIKAQRDQVLKSTLDSILKALNEFKDCGVIFTKSNSDTDSKVISNEINKYVKKNKDRCVSFDSLGSFLYFSTLKQVQCVIGNSSSGIIEVPSFKIPTVNIGSRQTGREKAESIIDVKCNFIDIVLWQAQFCMPNLQELRFLFVYTYFQLHHEK